MAHGESRSPGRAGKAAKVEAQTYNLGSANCKGQAVSIVTDAKVVERRLHSSVDWSASPTESLDRLGHRSDFDDLATSSA